MCRSLISPFLYMLFALAGPLVTPRAAFAADGYDVSYLWSHDIDGVRAYRERVASVLGPAVAKDLKVVASGELFGLVYLRNGDSSRGLEAASPVRERDWRPVGGGETRRVSVASLDTSKVSRSKMITRERSREIHDLEVAVENYIDQLRREGKIAPDERTGWSVYDFTTGEKLVTINEDEQFQAASLVKPFIAAAFFHRVSSFTVPKAAATWS